MAHFEAILAILAHCGGVGGRYEQGDVETGVFGKDMFLGCGDGVLILSTRRGDVPIFRQVAANMASGLGLPISHELALGSCKVKERGRSILVQMILK